MAMAKQGRPGKPKSQPVKKTSVPKGTEAPKGEIRFGAKGGAGTRGSKRGAC